MNNQVVPYVAAGGSRWIVSELLKLALVPTSSLFFPHSQQPAARPASLSSCPACHENVFECPAISECPVCPNEAVESILIQVGSLAVNLPEPLFHALIGILIGLAWWPFLDFLYVLRVRWRNLVLYWAGAAPRRPHYLPNPLTDTLA